MTGATASARAAAWLEQDAPAHGIGRLSAALGREAYTPHRHDTYTIALTLSGVQEFSYRGTVHRSLPGQVVVLHPDELHDGRAGDDRGFAYRTLYLEPAQVRDALRDITQASTALPFARNPVLDDAALAGAIAGAFGGPLEPLRADALVHDLTVALLRAAQGRRPAARQAVRATSAAAERPLARVREYLDANALRVVHSAELEQISGLGRHRLCALFRRQYGTSPYRYLLMRRLDHARQLLAAGAAPADVAAHAGFADQAHLTRQFKAAFGLTPARHAALARGARASSARP